MSPRFTFQDKLTVTLTVSAFLLSSVLSGLVYFFFMEKYHDEIASLAHVQAEAYKKNYLKILDDAEVVLEHLQSLLQSRKKPLMQMACDKDIESKFLMILQTQPEFFQVRLLDAEGMERLRAERTADFPAGHLTPPSRLADKSHRYYFTDMARQPENRTWISYLDLNIEHGRIQTPYQPTLRIGRSLYENERFAGIVIINLDLHFFLDQVVHSSLFEPTILDQDGEIIVHPDAAYRWSRMLGHGYNVRKVFPNIPAALFEFERTHSQDYAFFAERLFVNQSVGETLWLLFATKHDVENYAWSILKAIVLVNLLLIPFHILTANIVSRSYRRLEREQKIQKELLVQKSKLASIGEMISFIAHQWRQPLNAMASSLMRARTDLQFDRFDQIRFLQMLDQQEQRLEYLSQTIEKFRQFYTPANEQTNFTFNEAIRLVLELVGPSIREQSIELNLKLTENEAIRGNKNEFTQVLLNLINNACDILEERRVEQGKVTVRSYRQGDRLCLDVSDNGGGIDTKPIEKVFAPYYTTRSESLGTGIGLYISRLIIEQHFNGTLKARNGPGGAVFTLCIT